MSFDFERLHPRGRGGRFASTFSPQEQEGSLQVQPRSEIEWSRRAILSVVATLGPHADSLTLIGGHGVHVRTQSLQLDILPTGDGDLSVTPSIVADHPSIEALMIADGWVHRTPHRPGLWGRTPYQDGAGTTQYREKIDLSAARSLSGSASKSKRGVPALAADHGKHSVNNADGLELAAYDRSLEVIDDIADANQSAQVNVASTTALLVAKAYKVSDRLDDPRTGNVKPKDMGDLWRLTACGNIEQSVTVLREHRNHPEIGDSIAQGQARLHRVLSDPACIQMAFDTFEGIVAPDRIADDFHRWASAIRSA